MKLKIKKGDLVKVTSGSDKGKEGSVLDVNLKAMKVRVQGVRMQTDLNKKDNTLVKTEGFISYSNVALVDGGKKKAAAKKPAKKSEAKAKA